MNVGSLFSGIGGFDLGLERAGMRTAWFCEREPFCAAVLAKHWPGVPCYPDITELRGADVEPVDVLCGGFPCQDLSYAGAGAGLAGARSGLWSEYARLVGELRPRYVVVENVSALLARGLGVVLGDLAALGYDAEWDCIPASAVGAPHRRDRVWLVAYPSRDAEAGAAQASGAERQRARPSGESGGSSVAYAADVGCRSRMERDARRATPVGNEAIGQLDRRDSAFGNHWAVEPRVGRVADGVPARVDRLAALGNALVPQIAEWIGRRIVAHEAGRDAA